MARVIAIALGYYNHRRVKVGESVDMKEVDKKGFYIDEKGKRKLFPVLSLDGSPKKDDKGVELKAERKCKWVAEVGTVAAKAPDPRAVAAVISGKNPGAKPAAEFGESSEE